MNDIQKSPVGYTCACGHANRFDSYVFAHWNETLRGKCEGCQRPVRTRAGWTWGASRRKGDKGRNFERILK